MTTAIANFHQFVPSRLFLCFFLGLHGVQNKQAMETVLGMAFAMGRTLVLPPEKEMYLLRNTAGKHGKQQNTFSFNHFFHMEAIHDEHRGLDVITMQQFLERTAMQGKLKHHKTGMVVFPPQNITEWDGRRDIAVLFQWLRDVGLMAQWNPEECLAAFPATNDPTDIQTLRNYKSTLQSTPYEFEKYVGKPPPIDAPALDRLLENRAGRSDLCIYDGEMQSAMHVHFPTDHKLEARLLVHFYAFLFFQSYKHDLYFKRFVRDHVRYVDEIQCAAARVVAAVREHARDPVKNPNGLFDAFHVRRGDFQYLATRVGADVLLEMAQRKIADGTTLYIATDERDKSFFKPLKDHYDVVFLDDFHDQALVGINTNFYGMIDQLVGTRSRVFFGCWFSTFTGYMMRLRGYHADEEEQPGYEQGIHNSWFYALPDRFDHMQMYYPVKKSFFAREFPTSWRLIDSTLETD
jgi:GDP-fucose protein O-fucosyltransferase